MIPPSGTFDYVTIVLDSPPPWPVAMRVPVAPTGEPLRDDRLVGMTPMLAVAEAGSTPNPGYTKGVWRPNVERSRITLESQSRERATARAISFHVDRFLTAALRPDDRLYMASTPCGGMGFSVVRDEELLLAAGVITAIPLGVLEARIVFDLMELAEAPLRERDPVFQFPEVPIEVMLGRSCHLGLRGQCKLGRYRIAFLHGFYPGTPGTDECAAVWRDDAPDTAAAATARLLDADGFEITGW